MPDSTHLTPAARSEEAHHHEMRDPGWFSNVLVGVDGSPGGRDAIALGDVLREPSGRLTLAHVVLSQTPSYRSFHATPVWAGSRSMLEGECELSDVVAELTGMASASVGAGLHHLAEDRDADLLVVGSCSRGAVARLLRGDDTQGSLSGAACAVAVAPRDYRERSRQINAIGVAYDGSLESESALAAARDLAARHGAAVRALTVISTASVGWGALEAAGWGEAIGGLEEAASDRLQSLAGVNGRVAVGLPGDALVAFGEEVDLLVVGSRSYGPVRRMLFGSTSAHLAHAARCPLLVVPRPRVIEHPLPGVHHPSPSR